jgi:SAM-dependent methyltransferase
VELRADLRYLTSTAYADDRLLRSRQDLYGHQRPRIDLVGETIAGLGELAGKPVADIGCGNGAYVAALVHAGARVVAIDLSAGMLGCLVAQPTGSVVADAQAMPVATASLEVVLAMHMLYHVPEPGRAVREAARVLRPEGKLVAAIGGPRHLVEATELWNELLVARLEEAAGAVIRDRGSLRITTEVALFTATGPTC